MYDKVNTGSDEKQGQNKKKSATQCDCDGAVKQSRLNNYSRTGLQFHMNTHDFLSLFKIAGNGSQLKNME